MKANTLLMIQPAIRPNQPLFLALTRAMRRPLAASAAAVMLNLFQNPGWSRLAHGPNAVG